MKKLLTAFAFFVAASIFAFSVSVQTSAPQFKVLAPLENQTLYGDKLPILFSVDNFTLIDAQKPQTGQGHILIWLDDSTKSPDTATKVISDTFTFSDVSYGNHTLVAQLVTTDNKALSPAQEVTVNFKTASLPSTTPPEATTFDKKTTAVILIIVALVIIAAWWYTRDEEMEEPTKSATPKKAARKTKRRK